MKRFMLLLALAAPLPAGAHPHIFIDTGFEVVVGEGGQVTHIRVIWTYDDFFSLLVTQDMGLDQDFDGVLTAEENQSLTGFDMEWDEGFYGDTVAYLDGRELSLSRPMEVTASFAEGKITTTHLRAVDEAPVLAGAELQILPYDETFYTAYEVTQDVVVTGRDGCAISRLEPDIEGQLALKQELLLSLDTTDDPVAEGIGNIGRSFATEVFVRCAGS